uniref:Uncharacterized protein n=1 Tax=Salix viminalis TaxID=40686 RepID=A0A6N2MXX3_SALVM
METLTILSAKLHDYCASSYRAPLSAEAASMILTFLLCRGKKTDHVAVSPVAANTRVLLVQSLARKVR